MKQKKIKWLLLPLVGVALSSCGGGLSSLYSSTDYLNNGVANFADNYFQEWSPKFDPNGTSRINTQDYEVTSYFQNWGDSNFHASDRLYNGNEMTYTSDWQDDADSTFGSYFGPTVKMSRMSSSFKNGIISKLFDGYIFCDGYGPIRRIQIKPNEGTTNNGFGFDFPMELNISGQNNSYVALQFKGATNVSDYGVSWTTMPTINLYFSFFERSADSNYDYVEYRIAVNNLIINTDIGDSHTKYSFVGFYISALPASMFNQRIIGMSLSYDLVTAPNGGLVPWTSESQIGLLTYELLLPHATWY